jgi:serine/threonine protein kinase
MPPDIPLRSHEERREAFGFEPDAYHLANEMEFARQTAHLPHIVPPIFWGHAGSINRKWQAYVAYPYFPRQDLDDFLRADSLTEDGAVPGRGAMRLLPPSDFQRVGRSLLVALNGLWLEARQRHRDIKPSNLLVDQNGAVWLTDFEVSSELGAGTTRDRKTPEYCAPEVLLPQNAPANDYVRGMAADAYSVGAVLYTLKTTVFPHWNTVKKHGAGQSAEPWELAAARAVGPPSAPIGMGPGAWAQLSALLAPDPFERLGLGDDGLEKLLKVAEMPEMLERLDREEIEREEVVRQVELKNPYVLQRALGENALETVSRFLDAEQNGD